MKVPAVDRATEELAADEALREGVDLRDVDEGGAVLVAEVVLCEFEGVDVNLHVGDLEGVKEAKDGPAELAVPIRKSARRRT